ncbi:hypothetical protein HDV00_011628 [Rhizophlyctis rosea]|nr:hypothetical protein HDV00_011628 [Rhizophlyctis rosea]
MKSAILSALLCAAGAAAHATIQEVTIGGQPQGAQVGIRFPSQNKNNPVTDVNSSSMTCNLGTNNSKKFTVSAGSSITLRWCHNQYTGGSCTGDEPVIADSHKGPLMAYMAPVSDATSSSAPTSGWFKIYEDGLSGGRWAVDKLISNGGLYTVTIPSCLAPGDYLLRGELIALHNAYSQGGAQLYNECVQLTVTGGGSTTFSGVSFPGAYKATDPGILINIYPTPSSYTIPGPRPVSCSGGSTGGNTGGNPTTTTRTTSSTAPRTTTTTVSSGGGSGNCAAKYGQCGGQGFSGPTCCQSGSTCKVSNQYYSQCL